MNNLFSKASSYLSSQADHQGAHSNKDEEHQKHTSSGGYGDLAQSLMQGATKSSGEDRTNKSASSTDGYKDRLAGAQSLMGAAKAKPNDEGVSIDEEAHKSSGLSKPSADVASIDKEEDAHKIASSGYGDLLASTQVLMKAAKANNEADMGEVAGAAADLIGAAGQYGNLEKTSYGEYANKAQAYLHDYQASHGKPAAKQGSTHQSPALMEGKEEGSTLVSEEPPTSKQGLPYTSSST